MLFSVMELVVDEETPLGKVQMPGDPAEAAGGVCRGVDRDKAGGLGGPACTRTPCLTTLKKRPLSSQPVRTHRLCTGTDQGEDGRFFC